MSSAPLAVKQFENLWPNPFGCSKIKPLNNYAARSGGRSTIPKPVTGDETRSANDLGAQFFVICWNDPVNLMVYVTHVL